MSTRRQRHRHVPQRTCVICRQKRDKRQLTRIVGTEDGQVVIDRSGKQAGRGAYLCEKASCWDAAVQGGGLKKALKLSVRREDLERLAAHRPAADTGNAL